MRKKRALPLLALLTAGSMLFLSGCNVDVTTINEEEVSIEVEMEEQNLAEGMIMMHTIWYDQIGEKLTSADVAFYEEDTLLFSGTTNEEGSLATCALPCNTEIYCSVSDPTGDLLSESTLIIKLSDDYGSLSVYPVKEAESLEELPQSVIEVPTDKTNLRAAIFLTENSGISFANLTPYVEPQAEPEEPVASEEEEEAAETAEELEAEEIVEEIEEPEANEATEEVEAIEATEEIEEVEAAEEAEAEGEATEEVESTEAVEEESTEG